ncbi:MAG TPA: hypothetical protein DEV64_11985 [Rhodospirillaceae bacterium]|mgnify:FL=1|nr:hypothetical protein [Rhodospirillaceae bacterium]
MSRTVLITTLPPYQGGVPAMTEILARFLKRRGHDVTVAHYATLTDDSDLVVPSWQSVTGKIPRTRTTTCFGDFPCVSVGCRFPELEFPYYLTTSRWKNLIRAHDRHIAVGGTVLVANPLVMTGVPHMMWCASTMLEDRVDRRAAMPAARRVVDRLAVGPVQRQLEKRILAGRGRFMAISNYTRDTLIAAGACPNAIECVPVPVDLKMYSPPATAAPAAHIGFAGRVGDPRKNIGLLVRAVAVLAGRNIPVRLKLTGDPEAELNELAAGLNIADRLDWTGWLDPGRLSDFYRSLDVFVFSSAQEGLGISGVQAMACGVPVVSTRCGGPEDYVIDGKTGKLAGNTPEELADAIAWIVADRDRRNETGAAARTLIVNSYSEAAFEDNVARTWAWTWDEVL